MGAEEHLLFVLLERVHPLFKIVKLVVSSTSSKGIILIRVQL